MVRIWTLLTIGIVALFATSEGKKLNKKCRSLLISALFKAQIAIKIDAMRTGNIFLLVLFT